MSKEDYYKLKIQKTNLELERMQREIEEENKKKAEREKKAKAEAFRNEVEGAIEQRKAMISKIVGFYVPKKVPAAGDGALDHVEHSTNLNPEAQAMGLIMDLIICAFEMLFNIPYLKDKIQFDAALKKEIEAKLQGKNLELIYRGQPLYKIDRQTGKPDPTRLVKGKPSEFDIIGNGYLMEPDAKKGLLKALDRHQERMRPGWITSTQKMRLYGVLDMADQEGSPKKRNLARDMRLLKGKAK